jgi:kynureninase
VPTNVTALGVDAYVSGTLKWLFGGPGTAFLWVRPEIRDALPPTTTGWFSSARQFDFDVTSLDLAPDGRAFEMGTPSVPSAYLARGGMALVREIGVEVLHARTIELGALAIREALAGGLAVRAVEDDAWRGGIVAIECADPAAVTADLKGAGFIVDYRPGIVRLSPAFYNTEDEVRGVVDAIGRVAGGLGYHRVDAGTRPSERDHQPS